MFYNNKKKDKSKKDDKTEKEMLLVKDLFHKFEVARNAKSSFVDKWDDCLDAYKGNYFKNTNLPDYKSDEISNYIFSTIETIKPIMFDSKPVIQALPKTPSAIGTSELIAQILESEWDRDRMSPKLAQAVTLCLQIGTAIFMNYWNGKDSKMGNVNNVLINPFNFFPDPMAHDVDSAEYILYATYKHVNKLKQMYPDKSEYLDSGTINYEELIQDKDSANVTNQVLVLECYMRDYTTYDYEEIEETKNDKGEAETIKKKTKKRKFPKGRVITIAPELDCVLSDKELPYEDGKFPFTIMKAYDVPFQFWGMGEIEQLISPQKYINDLTNQIIDNAKTTANNAWLVDKNSGIARGQLTNRPGLIIRKNPGTDVKRLTPPPLPTYVFDTVNSMKRDMEIISGIHDVTQGRKPGSIAAGVAIMALQEAAQARIRLKVNQLEDSLIDLGKKWFAKIQQFWIVERYVRYIDDNEDPQFYQIAPDDLQVDVDISIVSGSTMPQNRNAMFDLMIRLAQTSAEDGRPMIDRETVLSYTNIPHRRRVINRFKQLAGETQQQEQSQHDQQIADQQMAMAQRQQGDMEQAMLEGQMQQDQIAQQQQFGQQPINDMDVQNIIRLLTENPQILQMVLGQVGASQGIGEVPLI